jgi:hypothetical protein
MKNLLWLFGLFLLFTSSQLIAQKYTISGYVEDAGSGERMVGVNVVAKELSLGTTTNTYGFYSITLPTSSFNLELSFIGYEKYTIPVNLTEDMHINIPLVSQSLELQEVTLIGEESIVKRTQSSVIDVPVQQIKSMPALLGEVDVLKAIQLLPGVQSGSEGTSGFYVRGGGPDQNLILLDGVPVYNASHLFGFFSVFNADAIKNVRLTKGGFPARFGGRLSSVLEIDMKEGNTKEFGGEGSIGLIASKITLQGPIIKDKASCIISARRTYIDALAQPFIMAASDGNRGGYYFYDLNAKVNYKISDKDRLYWSVYTGDDRFYASFSDSYTNSSDDYRFRLGWGNLTSSLRWNHLFNEKLFSNTTLTFSEYLFDIDMEEEYSYNNFTDEFEFRYYSGIRDWGVKMDFDYLPNPNHYIKFGLSETYHTFYPGQIDLRAVQSEFEEDNIDTSFVFSQRLYSHDAYVYLEDDIKFNERLKANIGIHASLFSVGDKKYPSLQPRFSARYLIDENWSAKVSYAEMQQNIHLLTNSNAGLPTDIWVPSTEVVKPQKSKQVAAALTRILKDGVYELSLEAYYKTMSNLITYKEGSSFMSFRDWQETVETNGQGESYGLELFLQKKKGKTSGWIGYTLSWASRRFDNINFGEWYSYKYDRRHDISVVLSHKFSEYFDMGVTWVYGTGNAITFPQASYLPNQEQGGYLDEIEYYGERNGTRMSPYHRLDLGANFRKEKPRGIRTITVGVYNAYNRKNPYFIYLGNQWSDFGLGGSSQKVARQISLFPIIPSITYNFKF